MRTADLEAEWRAAQAALSPDDARALDLWLPRGVIVHMVGIAKVRLSGGGACYEPDTAGRWAYISPARSATQNCCGGWGANQRRPERDAGTLIDQYGPQQLCAIPAGGADGVTRAGYSGPTAAAPFAPIAASPYTDWDYPWAVLGGELVDLICWDIPRPLDQRATSARGAAADETCRGLPRQPLPTDPHAWASRCGSAEWLGCASRNEPTAIRRSPVDWLRHRCSGLVLLTRDLVRQYEILTDCNDIVAEDEIHADVLNALLVYPYPRKAVFIT